MKENTLQRGENPAPSECTFSQRQLEYHSCSTMGMTPFCTASLGRFSWDWNKSLFIYRICLLQMSRNETVYITIAMFFMIIAFCQNSLLSTIATDLHQVEGGGCIGSRAQYLSVCLYLQSTLVE
jgi:hypothetical protein